MYVTLAKKHLTPWAGLKHFLLFSVTRGIQAERLSRHCPLDQDQRFPHSAKPALRIGKGQTTDGDGDEYQKGILRCVDSKRWIWMAGSAGGEKPPP